MTASDFVRKIEAHVAPDSMSQQEALDFLEEVISQLEASAEGLKEDMLNAEEDEEDGA
jgi:hypothetical protein